MRSEYDVWDNERILKNKELAEDEQKFVFDRYLCSDPVRPEIRSSAKDYKRLLKVLKGNEHFAAANDLVKQAVLKSLAGKRLFKLPNILLVGSPGIGKSRFANGVSDAIGLDVVKVNCTGADPLMELQGSNSRYSQSSPGSVAEYLREGDYNFLLYLDELDKAYYHGRKSFCGYLLTILEKETSGSMTDDFFGCAFDCRGASIIATANDTRSIPETILDRFEIVNIRKPTPEQMEAITKSIWGEICIEYEFMSKSLAAEVIEKCVSHTPRRVCAAMDKAVGLQLQSMACSSVEGLENLKAGSVRLEGKYLNFASERKSIGFI